MSTPSSVMLREVTTSASESLAQMMVAAADAVSPFDQIEVPLDGPTRSSVRVGIDVVSVADVAVSVARFGAHYLDRMFTPHELASCRGDASLPEETLGYSMESLAARFAAKEAVVKVLRPVGPRPEWQSIEVERVGGGWCEIRLTGRASALAAVAGISEWAVSLTHEAAMAAAVVVGVCRSEIRPIDRPTATALREE